MLRYRIVQALGAGLSHKGQAIAALRAAKLITLLLFLTITSDYLFYCISTYYRSGTHAGPSKNLLRILKAPIRKYY